MIFLGFIPIWIELLFTVEIIFCAIKYADF